MNTWRGVSSVGKSLSLAPTMCGATHSNGRGPVTPSRIHTRQHRHHEQSRHSSARSGHALHCFAKRPACSPPSSWTKPPPGNPVISSARLRPPADHPSLPRLGSVRSDTLKGAARRAMRKGGIEAWFASSHGSYTRRQRFCDKSVHEVPAPVLVGGSSWPPWGFSLGILET